MSIFNVNSKKFPFLVQDAVSSSSKQKASSQGVHLDKYLYTLADDQGTFNLSRRLINDGVNLSTLQFEATKDFLPPAVNTNIFDVHWKPDGMEFYIIDYNKEIYRFLVSSAYDISTASKDGSVTLSEASGVNSFWFKPDGTKMYVSMDEDIYQYTLSPAWDIYNITYDSVSIASSAYLTSFRMNRDGDVIYELNSLGNTLDQRTLATAWDISSVEAGSTSETAGTNSPQAMAWSNNGMKLYISDPDDVALYQYACGVAYNITGMILEDTINLDAGLGMVVVAA
jgi:hypothetical protein